MASDWPPGHECGRGVLFDVLSIGERFSCAISSIVIAAKSGCIESDGSIVCFAFNMATALGRLPAPSFHDPGGVKRRKR
jgi:hypothetical protein